MECCFPLWEALFWCNIDLLDSMSRADIRLGVGRVSWKYKLEGARKSDVAFTKAEAVTVAVAVAVAGTRCRLRWWRVLVLLDCSRLNDAPLD